MTTRNPTSTSPIPVVRRGDTIDADLFNRISAMAARAGRLRVGPGLTMRIGADGCTVSLDPGFLRNRTDPCVFGRISAVAGGSGPAAASAFTYSFTAFARPELPVYSGLTPEGGRPVKPTDTITEVFPSRIDSWAILILEPTGDGTTAPKLYLMEHEKYAVEDCAPEAISDAQDLDLSELLDHVLVDADGDPVVDADGKLVSDGGMNAVQNAEFLDCVVIDANGKIVTDANKNVVVDANASPEAAALWNTVLVDASGEVVVDANWNIVTVG